MALRSFGALLLFTTSSCIPSIKSVFVDLSYPADPTPSAARDVVRSLDAVVTPTLLNGYEQPSEVGACLGELITSYPQHGMVPSEDLLWCAEVHTR